MNPPFSREQFLQVFANYNTSIYPAQIFILQLALLIIFFGVKKTRYGDKFISAGLSLLWLWMGIVYHIIYFSKINKAAYIFGIFYIIQAFLFFYYGDIKNTLSFNFKKDAYGYTGSVMILYAIIIYPLLGFLFGHLYPKSPTFGLPCPTAIFTFGILLWASKKIPFTLLVIPLLWSILGFSAVIYFGIYEDTGLIAAAGIVSLFLVFIKKPDKKKVRT